MSRETVAILGSGNAGHAVAAILSLAGHRIRLYGRRGFQERLLPVRSLGGIALTGVAGSGLAPIENVTDDLEEALAGANVIVVATPATAHDELAHHCAPLLSDGQVVLILQGMLGSLFFSRALHEATRSPRSILAETATLPYTCRILSPGHVHVSRVSRRHLSAAFPGRDSETLVQQLRPLFPFLVPATHVLEAALYNPNPLLHPAGTALNLGRIETAHGDFCLYQEGFTSSVWTLVNSLDREKMSLLRALGLPALPYLEEFRLRNEDTFSDFASLGIRGPSAATDRYITEDVPIGLVLFSTLGSDLDVPTPVCDALITLCSVINGTDYRSDGRTAARLGLPTASASALTRYLVDGHLPGALRDPRRHSRA